MFSLGAALAVAPDVASAQSDPFYKGKRLTVLINFSAGGPTDIEGRLFAKHLVKHIDGAPSIVIQNMDGAGGVVGAKYMGEVAPRDGTMAGYFTGTAFMYALDPERFRVDFKSYEFVATPAGTTVHFVRTDVPPGMKDPADIVKAQGLVAGGLTADTSKDLRMRMVLDMLGVTYKYVTGYRSSSAARLAFQRGEVNMFSESPPSYRSVVHPGIVKEGLAIPVWHEAERGALAAKPVADLPIAPFDEVFKAVKGRAPEGPLWDAFRTVRTVSGTMIRILALPPGAPKPAVDALRAAVMRMNSDPVYAADAIKTIGFVPEYATGPNTNHEVRTALTVTPQMRAFLADYVKKANR
ncbi:MAG: hypothetical protein ACREVB_08960 [Burkholderiales bacterium]